LETCRLGASRELFEETGMDMRNDLKRFEPAILHPPHDNDDIINFVLGNNCYFHLQVNDTDFFSLPVSL
jgi:hypothetical protein